MLNSYFLAFKTTGCISISSFARLLGIPIWITSSILGLKGSAIITGIKNYQSILEEKNHDKIV